MLKKSSELKFRSSRQFDSSRKDCVKTFTSGSSFFKRKITQGLYWTALDKDLANQFLRDERWLLGLKFWDAVKIIDHGASSNSEGKNVGFKVTKK